MSATAVLDVYGHGGRAVRPYRAGIETGESPHTVVVPTHTHTHKHTPTHTHRHLGSFMLILLH